MPHQRSDSGPDRDPEDVLADLGRIVLEGTPLTLVLQRVVQLASDVLPDATDVSVTFVDQSATGELRPGTARSVAVARSLALKLDERQYDTGSGPCLDAAASGEIIRTAPDDQEERYPEFAGACRAAGVRETLSIGLPVRQRTAMSVNIYGGRFADEEVELATALAAHVAVAVANANLSTAMRDLARNVRRATQPRAVIEQAKGIIMARNDCSAGQALDRLRQESQERNVGLRDIAQRVVDARGE